MREDGVMPGSPLRDDAARLADEVADVLSSIRRAIAQRDQWIRADATGGMRPTAIPDVMREVRYLIGAVERRAAARAVPAPQLTDLEVRLRSAAGSMVGLASTLHTDNAVVATLLINALRTGAVGDGSTAGEWMARYIARVRESKPDVDADIAAYFESRPTEAAVPAPQLSVWLVERRVNGRPAWLHFDAHGFDKWSHDPLEADRFPNRQSAAIVAGSFPYPEVVQATEHVFMGAAVPAPAAPSPIGSVAEARERLFEALTLVHEPSCSRYADESKDGDCDCPIAEALDEYDSAMRAAEAAS